MWRQNRGDDVLRLIAVRLVDDQHVRRDQGRAENDSHTLSLKVSEHLDDLPVLVRLGSCSRHGASDHEETGDGRKKACG
jgi:hypothetical protein